MRSYADEPRQSIITQINASGTITVEAPEALKSRVEFNDDKPAEANDNATSTARPRSSVGYRVEIFADNNVRTAKGQAQARRASIASRLPQYQAYIVFESPYWRVRVGDFAKRAEAEAAMADIRRAFPAFSSDLRIVRSRIK